jgi:NAD(P)-dependent dehydrogenase (short-subunit alcohol dehydrogenase family)
LSNKLAGRVALVTGGRGGIGRAICARFLREGATVFAADLTREGSLAQAVDDFVKFDVTSEADAQAAMAEVAKDCGKLDVLVNAAGIEIEKTIEHTTLADWNRIFAINVTGTFLASKYALPLLRKSRASSRMPATARPWKRRRAACIPRAGSARRRMSPTSSTGSPRTRRATPADSSGYSTAH